jgi:hypothetical protein
MESDELDLGRITQSLKTRLDEGNRQHRSALAAYARAVSSRRMDGRACELAVADLLRKRAHLATLFLEADEQVGVPIASRQEALDEHMEIIVEMEEIISGMASALPTNRNAVRSG